MLPERRLTVWPWIYSFLKKLIVGSVQTVLRG